MRTFSNMCKPDLEITKAAYEAMIMQMKNSPVWTMAEFEEAFDPLTTPSELDKKVKNRTLIINRLKELIAVIQIELAFHE